MTEAYTKIHTMSLVFLILGGNRGNRTELFSAAIELVTNRIGPIKAISSQYGSESWGFESEPFMNQVINVETVLSPMEVLTKLQQIEVLLGRVRNVPGYEPRTIDVDLLFFDNCIINSTDLTLPHPRIAERKFVLVPLAEIAPDLLHPVTGKSVCEMLASCPDPLKVWKMAE